MMLVDDGPIAAATLPMSGFREHLRLGSGFADDSLQDGLVESCLRAALSAVEARTSKAVLTRRFTWTVSTWRHLTHQVLPIAPVFALVELRMADRNGVETVVDPARIRLEPGMSVPKLVATGLHLPLIPTGGSAILEFDAGFGATWNDVPADLAQAVFLLAAYFYENRSGGAVGIAPIPADVSLLIERYRAVRLFGEAGR